MVDAKYLEQSLDDKPKAPAAQQSPSPEPGEGLPPKVAEAHAKAERILEDDVASPREGDEEEVVPRLTSFGTWFVRALPLLIGFIIVLLEQFGYAGPVLNYIKQLLAQFAV